MSDLPSQISAVLLPSTSPVTNASEPVTFASDLAPTWDVVQKLPTSDDPDEIVTLELMVTQRLTVPQGSCLVADVYGDRFVLLPDGTYMKPFLVMEQNEHEDMTYAMLYDKGCELTEVVLRTFDVVEDP